MATETTVNPQVQDFSLSASVVRGNIQLLLLNNLFCQCFERSDHGDVEKLLTRELQHGQRFFVASILSDLVGFATWHPDGEARNGTGELRYVGWLQGVPGTVVVPALLEAVERNADRWFREKKQVQLRKLFARIPAHRTGARTALEVCGFRVEANLPRNIDNTTDELFLGKYYPQSEVTPLANDP